MAVAANDRFILIANPNAESAEVAATYLLPDGTNVMRNYVVPAESRFNIWVDLEVPELADTAVATTITVTNNVPVIVERAMWWPGPTPATRLLIANTSEFAGSASVTLLFEDSTTATRTFPLTANNRFNVAVAAEFPEAAGRRFGAIVESVGEPAAQIVVERAMYSNADGVSWAAGTNALATPLP